MHTCSLTPLTTNPNTQNKTARRAGAPDAREGLLGLGSVRNGPLRGRLLARRRLVDDVAPASGGGRDGGVSVGRSRAYVRCGFVLCVYGCVCCRYGERAEGCMFMGFGRATIFIPKSK